MKKVLYLVFALFIAVFMTAAVYAQCNCDKHMKENCGAGTCAKVKKDCGKHMKCKDGSFMDELQLTSEQQTKIKEIKASAKAKKEAVLTPAQKAEIEKRIQAKKENKDSQTKLAKNKQSFLTDSQKAQMKAIHEETKKEIRAVLTPEQQKKFDEKAKNCQGKDKGKCDCNCGCGK